MLIVSNGRTIQQIAPTARRLGAQREAQREAQEKPEDKPKGVSWAGFWPNGAIEPERHEALLVWQKN